MRYLNCMLVCLGTLSSCGFEQREPLFEAEVASREDEIVGGTLTSGDPAVVSIGLEDMPFCSGTLVGPKTVVTAAHCIYAYGENAVYYAFFGPNAYAPTRKVRITAQYAHPKYNGESRDLGVLRLQTAVTNVVPIELNSTPFSDVNIGQPIRHVGYGITGAGRSDSGLKRQVSYSLAAYTDWLLLSGGNGKQTCQGDSGGPAFMTLGADKELLVGVVSFGDADCAQFGADARIDTDLEWIRNTLSKWETPTCNTDGLCAQGCATPDQDCVCVADGACHVDCIDVRQDPDCPKDCAQNNVCTTQACPRPDPDCVPVGGQCKTEDFCQSRTCIEDAQSNGFYCTQGCDPSTPCPQGMECNSAMLCQFIQRPERDFDQICQATDYCRNRGVCTGPAEEAKRCAQACKQTSDCAQGYSCELGIDGIKFCRSPIAVLEAINITQAPQNYAAPEGCAATGGAPWSLLALSVLCHIRSRKSR